jgi:hypothetical protein
MAFLSFFLKLETIHSFFLYDAKYLEKFLLRSDCLNETRGELREFFEWAKSIEWKKMSQLVWG